MVLDLEGNNKESHDLSPCPLRNIPKEYKEVSEKLMVYRLVMDLHYLNLGGIAFTIKWPSK